MDRYNHLNKYYKDKFGERVLKICVDGGFTCPNRDGSKGVGGCVFCSAKGSGEHIKCSDVATQVKKHLDSYRGERANKFIVYFQNFSNTYADIATLRKTYNSAFVSDKIIGISIATRPDCINEEVVKLLCEYKDKYFVMVELGLQTADEDIAKGLNLQYTSKDFEKAVKILKQNDIEVVAHIMLGLPKENKISIDKTINLLNACGVDGVKIHNLYIVEGSALATQYQNNPFKLLSQDEYLIKLEYILTRLNPNMIIHRISGDAPKDKLIAPVWNVYKKYILNGIDKLMRENNTWQGREYSEELKVKKLM